jgi:shikimate dehydrogenase
MKLYGLIGYPLGHSFSEKYFTEKFAAEGISGCQYKAFPIQNINELRQLLAAHNNLRGFNITIPHKQSIIPLLDDTSHLPGALNACNCVTIRQGRLIGYNTDVVGFEKSLLPQLQPFHTRALILGNGGAAQAVKFVLRKLNIGYKVVSRKLNAGAALTYADLNKDIIKEHLLIINTTPLGTFPVIEECPGIPYEHITEQHFLFDLVYNPAKTLFLQKGEVQGAAIKNGGDMLVLQAEESWRIWNENSSFP